MPINWKGIKTTGNRFYDANRIAEMTGDVPCHNWKNTK
jgi:hypothetical protein